jgi:hypothetical protein
VEKTMNQVYTMKPSSRVDDVLLKQEESMVPQGKRKWLPAADGKQPEVAQRR